MVSGQVFVIGDHHAAFSGGQSLVGVKGKDATGSESSLVFISSVWKERHGPHLRLDRSRTSSAKPKKGLTSIGCPAKGTRITALWRLTRPKYDVL
jgi:hypothetical protein